MALSGTFARIDCSLTNVLSTLSRDRIRRAIGPYWTIGRFKRSFKKASRNTHRMLELFISSTFLQFHPDSRKLWTRPPQVRKRLWVFQPEEVKPARNLLREFPGNLCQLFEWNCKDVPHCATLQIPQTSSGIRTLQPLCR